MTGTITKLTTIVRFTFIVLLGTLLICGCSNDSDKTADKATPSPTEETESSTSIATYTIADPTGDWGYPSPYLRYSRGPGYIRSSFIFDTLIWKNQDGFIPALAKEWSYNETENAYTFKLQQNARWHDGEPFTPEDVAFTIEYMKEHPDPFVTIVGASGVSRTEIINDHTIKLYLESKYAPFLYAIAGTMTILPKHIW